MKNASLKLFLWAYLCLTAFAAIYVYGFIMLPNGDNVEHLHSAWLIWQGNIPYRDFFQHHNPLLWYVSMPLVAALINHIEIFSVFNAISIIALIATIYYEAKILQLGGCSKNAVLFMSAVTLSSFSVLSASNYRPDTFMFLFLLMGIYFLLNYVKTPCLWKIIVAGICFFIAFMLTQKVLLNFVVPGLFILYWLASGKISPKDFLLAALLPLLLLSLYVAYLYNNGALAVYWQANFPFNTYIPSIFYESRITLPPQEYFEFYFFVPLGGIAALYFLYRGNFVETLLSLMFWEELGLRMFYFSAFLHYSIFLLMLSIMLIVALLDKFAKTKKVISVIGIVYLVFMWEYNYQKTYKPELESHNYINGHEFVFYNSTPCDYVINGYYSVYNLKAKDAGYYWVLLGQIDVLGEKSGIAPRDNLNDLIIEKKPKIIFGGTYWDTYWEQRGKKILAHRIDPYLLNTYYEPAGVGNMYILKKEYQKRFCRFDGRSWKYRD